MLDLIYEVCHVPVRGSGSRSTWMAFHACYLAIRKYAKESLPLEGQDLQFDKSKCLESLSRA